MKIELFSTQKSAMTLSFNDINFFADLQGRIGRFANLALYKDRLPNLTERLSSAQAGIGFR